MGPEGQVMCTSPAKPTKHPSNAPCVTGLARFGGWRPSASAAFTMLEKRPTCAWRHRQHIVIYGLGVVQKGTKDVHVSPPGCPGASQ
eukprot:1156393-Pelagomonas_calceolata.AAC.9